MPQFYFHLRTPEGRSDDDLGCAFADLDAAFLDTQRAIIDIGAEMLAKRQNPMVCAFEICDGDGRTLLTVPFDEVLRPKVRPTHDLQVLRRRAEQNVARGQGLKADLEAGMAEVRHNLKTLRETIRQI